MINRESLNGSKVGGMALVLVGIGLVMLEDKV